MVNVWLIIVMVVMLALISVASVYVLVYFSHPEDKNTAWFPKIVVVLSLTLIAVLVLMLPLDVANHSSDGELPMEALWQIAFMILVVDAIVVIPFTIFYYESHDVDWGNAKQVFAALRVTLASLVVFLLLTTLMYVFLGHAEVPVEQLTSPLFDADRAIDEVCATCSKENVRVRFRISLVIYIVSMVGVIGWFLFTLFGGVGLFSLPFDMINNYRYRPRRISLREYSTLKREMGQRANVLIQIGEKINGETRVRNETKKDKRNFNKFKAAVYALEEDFEKLETSYKKQGGDILYYWAQLAVGCLFVVVALMWMLHMCLFMLPNSPPTTFLNAAAIALDDAFGFLGTTFYGLFAFFLLWATVKGNFKFGLKFFVFTIHPMRIGGTIMSSFLFNMLLLLFSTVAVMHFVTDAFSVYTRLTAIDGFFNVGVKNLVFVQYFWDVYLWAFIIISFLTGVYQLFFSARRPKEVKKGTEFKL